MSLNNHITKIRTLLNQEQFDRVSALIDEIEKDHPLPPYLLLLRGICIQLGDASPYELKDAATAYRQAIDLDPTNHRAYLELGFFHARVMNQPSQAVPYFEEARDLLVQDMTEILTGLAEARDETNHPEDVTPFINPDKVTEIIKKELETLTQKITTHPPYEEP